MLQGIDEATARRRAQDEIHPKLKGWAEYAGIFIHTREAHLEHEKAKTELKNLMPEDARQAIGHGIRARCSKSGAISFDLLEVEGESHAARQ